MNHSHKEITKERSCKNCGKGLPKAKAFPPKKYCDMQCFRADQRKRKNLKTDILKWNAGLAQDIMDDIETFPDWQKNGALLGIKSVAMGIRDALNSLCL